jgi:hypothetical protein
MNSDEISTSPPCDNKFVDELTMKLLSNKTNYAKYLAMTDSRKHEERQQFIQDCRAYKDDMIDMTRRMCKNEDVEYSSDVTDAFDEYARTLIRYIEVKRRSDELQREYDQTANTSIDDEEDTMFPASIDEVKTKPKYTGSRSTLDFFIRK